MNNLLSLGIFSDENDMPWDYHFDNPPFFDEDKSIEKRSPFNCLPETISRLVSLRQLILSNSEITILPDYLGNLPKLEELRINGCNIAVIPTSIQRLVDNGELTLHKSDEDIRMREWGFVERRKPRRKPRR